MGRVDPEKRLDEVMLENEEDLDGVLYALVSEQYEDRGLWDGRRFLLIAIGGGR
ncbi:hypothetical protein BC829DRAFT_386487 [Chytridium lagenaria]|nr:hypothetical protein BC829DRAFT_386487 [Chytridium lagenaria]